MVPEHRLHPLSWLFVAGQAAKGFIIPAVFVLFASGGETYELWAAVFIVPIAAQALLHYAVFRYRLTGEDLIVRDGLLTRSERHIPYARIQNIDIVQNPLHRLMRVALVRVETASGTRPEAVIRVLSLEAVDAMRAEIFAGRAADATDDAGHRPVDDELVSLPSSELARLGVVSNKGLVVVSAALGVLWQRGSWMDGRESWIEDYIGAPPAWLTDTSQASPLALTVAIATVVMLAFLLLRLFSIGWFLVQLHRFTLSRHGQDLRAEYGLLTRVSRTIPPRRIQTLIVTESPLHRWFDRQSVELHMVGGGDAASDAGLEGGIPTVRSQWLAPIVPTGRVPTLLSDVLPDIDVTEVAWQSIDPRAWRRIFRRVWLGLSAATIPMALLVDPRALALIVPAGALAFVHARLTAKHAGYALLPWGVVAKSGWWNRIVKVVRYSKVQVVQRAESPFDRRAGMASVRLDTAGAERGGHTIDIPYLSAEVATEVATRLSQESSRHAFRWS